MAQVAAERTVQHLGQDGFVILRRLPAPAPIAPRYGWDQRTGCRTHSAGALGSLAIFAYFGASPHGFLFSMEALDPGMGMPNLTTAEQNAVACRELVPAPRPANTHGGFFGPEAFVYDPARDSMRCPAGRRLLRNGSNERDQARRYRAEDCTGCPLKPDCTAAERRLVYRSMHYDAMQRMTERVKNNPRLMRLRRSTVEHPFGTLKAATEAALGVLGYNLKRAIAVLGCEALIQRLA